jgi:hypothetical protein
LAVVAAFFVQPALYSGDELEIFVQARAIAEHGTLFLDDYVGSLPTSRQLRGTHGHVYSKYGVGYPFLAAGVMTITGSSGHHRHARNVRAFKWVNAFLFLLSGYVFYLLLERRVGRGVPLILVTFAYLCSTQATFYASVWCTNLSVMAFLVFAFYFFETSAIGGESLENEVRWRLVLCGACVGFAGLFRTFPFIMAIPFALALLVRWRSSWREAVPSTACLLTPIVVLGLAQAIVNFVKAGVFSGLYESEGFSTPFHIGFLGTLLWPGKSFLFFYPATLFCPLGLFALWRKSRSLGILCVLTIALYVVAYSKWWAWWSGPSLGSRFWLPALPFMLYPLAFLRRKTTIAVLCVLVAWGSYTQLQLYGQAPRVISRCIYQNFRHPEGTESVAATLAQDFWSPVRATFATRVLYRCLP